MKTRASDACRRKSQNLQLRTWRGRLYGSVAGGQKEKGKTDHMTHVCIILTYPASVRIAQR